MSFADTAVQIKWHQIKHNKNGERVEKKAETENEKVSDQISVAERQLLNRGRSLLE